MVPSIARQSVIIKCNMQKSILTGNYEFYYAAGLIAKLSGVEIPEDIKPEELLALLSEQIPMLTPADEKEKYLFGMVADYRPEDVYDEQMRELLDWGRTENISGRSHCRMTGRTHKGGVLRHHRGEWCVRSRRRSERTHKAGESQHYSGKWRRAAEGA